MTIGAGDGRLLPVNPRGGTTLPRVGKAREPFVRKLSTNYHNTLIWLAKTEIGSPEMKGPGRGKEREV